MAQLPKPSYVPDRSDWTMTCQSTTSGKTYEVSLFTNGKIVVGPNTYSYDGNWAKNGAGSYLAKGRTRYGHFVAVFHSTNPQPYIAFGNNKGEAGQGLVSLTFAGSLTRRQNPHRLGPEGRRPSLLARRLHLQRVDHLRVFVRLAGVIDCDEQVALAELA